MQHFGRLQAIWKSFYSSDVYRESVRSWKGIGLSYLTLLLMLSWFPSSVRWFLALRSFSSNEGRAIVLQLPRVRIENGVMSADPAGRHVIRDPERGAQDESGTLFIIDDTIEQASDQEQSDPTAEAILLTRREFALIRPSRNESRVWKLTRSADMDVTPDEVQAFLNNLPFWLAPLGYAVSVAGSFVFRTLQILLYGAIGLALVKKWNYNIDYRSLLRLAAVAVTPVVVLRTVIWFGPWEPGWYIRWPVAAAITLAYLSFGIRAAAVDSATLSSEVVTHP